MVPQKVILFQVMMYSTVMNALEETSVTSRSAFFVSRKNTRLKGHVMQWLYSHSFISCSQLCTRKTWCTSTNFKKASKKVGKGTCELNKHESSVMEDEGNFQSLQGVTFSLHLKGCLVTGCTDGSSCLFDEKKETFACLKQTACVQSVALGMEDGTIPENRITASSTDARDQVTWGRLHCSQGSWTPNTDTGYQWFQVEFTPDVKFISRIATQGHGTYYWWVRTYYVMYNSEGVGIQDYQKNNLRVTFQGNRDSNSVVTREITNPFQTDVVRIVPRSFEGRIALRIELYGCDI